MSQNKITLLNVIGSLAILAVPALADVYGTTELIQRTETDYCTGCLFAYAQAPAAASGHSLTSWAFYADQNPAYNIGRSITPLLFDSSFKIVGIGTTQTPAIGSQQSYSFGLTSGTDVVQTGDWFGWRDGSTTVGNNGIISLDLTGGPGVQYYTCDNAALSSYGTPCHDPAYPDTTTIAVGDVFAFTNVYTPQRVYSVDFTVPEPGLYVVLGMGLAMIALRLSRRLFV